MMMVNKYVAVLLIFFAVCGANAAETGAVVNINPSGVTTMSSKLGAADIRVTMQTHEVEISDTPSGKALGARSSCTFSRHPCVVVDALNISADGRELFIPRSLFADLSDLSKAILVQDGQVMKLTLYGGDASESFVLKVSFDVSRVKQRVLSSALSPDEPLQEPTYSERGGGD